jgi:hypothetical protein
MTKVVCGRYDCLYNNDCGDCLKNRVAFLWKKILVFDWLGMEYECRDYRLRSEEISEDIVEKVAKGILIDSEINERFYERHIQSLQGSANK